jgi:hypothetical protein
MTPIAAAVIGGFRSTVERVRFLAPAWRRGFNCGEQHHGIDAGGLNYQMMINGIF